MKLWIKVLIALFLGTLTGLVLGKKAEPLQLVGQIFLNLIQMIIVPLVFSSMTVGITSIHDPQKLGRVGLKALGIYTVTTALAIVIGLLFAKFFQPGAGMVLPFEGKVHIGDVPSLSDIILSIFPKNPFASMVQGNMLQIIVFAIFLGLSINFSGSKGKPFLEVLESLAEVMYRLTSVVMELSPIGVFAIMAHVTGTFGLDVLIKLAKFVQAYYFACLFHVGFVFCGILFLVGLNPIPFFKGLGDAIMLAFSTSSSSATLPVTMHCAQRNLGVSKNITCFVLPLGSTVNMNGSAIFQGMSAVFIAQAYGIELSWLSLLTIVITATLSAVGAAGIPGAGFTMLTVVFTSVGLPVEGLIILAGIDRVREMISTVLNILGDAVCAVVIAKQEGELDESQYNHEVLVELEGSDI